MSHTPWQRPRPSLVGYQLVYCLNLLATCKRWAWTNEFLIGKLLWPILEGAGSRNVSAEGEEVKEAAVVCVVRLVGKGSSRVCCYKVVKLPVGVVSTKAFFFFLFSSAM